MSFSARGSVSGTMSIDSSPTTSDYTIIMPPEQGDPNTVLQNDGTGTLSWVTKSSDGDVVGPASATDNAVARFDTTTGKLLQNSTVTINDSAEIAGVRALGLTGVTSGGVITMQPGATITNHTLTLPPVLGHANTLLRNNGSGILSWALGGGLIGSRTYSFEGPGTYNYVPTTGTTRALVYVTGGGGAGGGAVENINNSMGSGGNSGATIIGLFSITTGSWGTITIGAGGQGVSEGIGEAGGASSFLYPQSGSPSGQITAYGGEGGLIKPAGTIDTYMVRPNTTQATTIASEPNEVLISFVTMYGNLGRIGRSRGANVAEGGFGANSFWGGGGIAFPVNSGDDEGGHSGYDALGIDGSGAGGGGGVQTDQIASVGGAGRWGFCVIYEF